MYFVPQVEENDCGFACLKILLSEIHHDKNYLFLKQDEDHGPYSYQDLIIIAKMNSLSLTAFRVEDKEEILKCEHFPLIATLNLGKAKHAILLKKINKRKAVIIDPNKGIISLKTSEFLEKWDGSGLLVEKFLKEKCRQEQLKPISDNKLAFSNLLQFLSATFLVVGIYFFLPGNDTRIPLFCISMSLICEIAFRIYLYGLMKQMDDYFMEQLVFVEQKKYYDYFIRTEKYKSSLLVNSTTLIYYSFSVLFIIFVTILNSVSNLLLVVTPLVISALECLVFKPYAKKKNQEVEELETQIKECKDDKMFESLVKLTHDKAYSYSQFSLSRKIIEIAVLFLISLLTCYITNSYSLINVVFYLCLEIFLQQNEVNLLSFEDKKKDFNVNKIKVNNLIHQNDENE